MRTTHTWSRSDFCERGRLAHEGPTSDRRLDGPAAGLAASAPPRLRAFSAPATPSSRSPRPSGQRLRRLPGTPSSRQGHHTTLARPALLAPSSHATRRVALAIRRSGIRLTRPPGCCGVARQAPDTARPIRGHARDQRAPSRNEFRHAARANPLQMTMGRRVAACDRSTTTEERRTRYGEPPADDEQRLRGGV